MKDTNFLKTMNENGALAWEAFIEVVQNFIRKHKSENYKDLVSDRLPNIYYKCRLSLKQLSESMFTVVIMHYHVIESNKHEYNKIKTCLFWPEVISEFICQNYLRIH